jgi:thioesterase domain-containing protein
MAAYFLEWMRFVQPQGPYRVGGYCLGGVIAFEIARQLEERGERADLVAIFDGHAPVTLPALTYLKPRSWLYFLRNLPFWWRDFRTLDFQSRAASTSRFVRYHLIKYAGVFKIQPQFRLEDILDDIDRYPKRYQELMVIENQAVLGYKPQPIQGRLTLFRVQRLPLFRSFDPTLNWSQLTKAGVDVRIIEGAHANIIFKPFVDSLAEQLKDSITAIQS